MLSKTRIHLLLTPLAATQTFASVLPRTEKIAWGECTFTNTTLPYQCGNLTVPLDYINSSNSKTIELELIRRPASTQPAPKGSILLNFGGPGGDGLNNFLVYEPLQGPIIGDEFDIISWDPRGTRNTLPVICFDSTNPINAILGLGTYLTDWYNASDITPGQTWAEATVVSELCRTALAESGPYLGMASVARDIMSIVDALGEDGLLRYWGISGGTTMGATVAAMFPDRVDKVVLDGVMNAHEYYNSLMETEFVSSADDVLKGIFAACIEAGPEKCALAKHGKTCENLEQKFEQLIEDLKFDQITFVYPALGTGMVVNYSDFFSWLFSTLYRPKAYPEIVAVLEGMFRRDATAFVEASFMTDLDDLVQQLAAAAAAPTANTTTGNNTDNNGSKTPTTPTLPSLNLPQERAVWGIRCGDRRPRADSREALEPSIRELEGRSKWFAHFGLATNGYLCAQWPFEAVERYGGDFTGVKTRNPVLFVGNTFDPVTPLVSARNMSSGFEGSVLLQHDSYGHVSFSTQVSNCTNSAITDYLNEGKLPAEGTICKPNMPLISWVTGEAQALAQSAGDEAAGV